MPIKTFQLTVRLRNNLLIQRREELQMSAPVFAHACGVSYGSYIKLEAMSASPLDIQGEWRDIARAVAEFHGLGCDELWPDEVLNVLRPVSTCTVDGATLERALEEVLSPPQLPDKSCSDKERAQAVHTALEALEARDRLVLEYRFGFRGQDMTLREVGALVPKRGAKGTRRSDGTWKDGLEGTGGKRAQQIEQKALRTLRRPGRAKALLPHIIDD